MKILDTELAFSFTNPAHMKKYRAARLEAAKKCAGLPGQADGSEEGYIRLLEQGVLILCNFFDDLFGSGTANRLFGPQADLAAVAGAYACFLKEAEQQAEDLQQKMGGFLPDPALP